MSVIFILFSARKSTRKVWWGSHQQGNNRRKHFLNCSDVGPQRRSLLLFSTFAKLQKEGGNGKFLDLIVHLPYTLPQANGGMMHDYDLK